MFRDAYNCFNMSSIFYYSCYYAILIVWILWLTYFGGKSYPSSCTTVMYMTTCAGVSSITTVECSLVHCCAELLTKRQILTH